MKQITVLVVDDEAGIRDLLVDALSPHGYRVLTAPDGRAAIEIAKVESPDIAFVDIRMPGMSGVQLLVQLRSISATMQFIMITGHTRDQEVDEALQLGTLACLMKPFKMKDVVEIARIAQPFL